MAKDPVNTPLRGLVRALALYQARVEGVPRIGDGEVAIPFDDAFFLPPGGGRRVREPRRRRIPVAGRDPSNQRQARR